MTKRQIAVYASKRQVAVRVGPRFLGVRSKNMREYYSERNRLNYAVWYLPLGLRAFYRKGQR